MSGTWKSDARIRTALQFSSATKSTWMPYRPPHLASPSTELSPMEHLCPAHGSVPDACARFARAPSCTSLSTVHYFSSGPPFHLFHLSCSTFALPSPSRHTQGSGHDFCSPRSEGEEAVVSPGKVDADDARQDNEYAVAAVRVRARS